MWISKGGEGGCTVTNSGLWTIFVFGVMTFKRPEMTFKASEYLLVMTFDYFGPISFNFLYYMTILPWNTNVFKNPRVFLGSWPLRPRKWPLEVGKKVTSYFILFSINFSSNWSWVSRINMKFPRNHIYWHMTLHYISTQVTTSSPSLLEWDWCGDECWDQPISPYPMMQYVFSRRTIYVKRLN